MTKRIDDEARKRDIAAKAMSLFAQVGYDNVTLLAVANAAALSRTVIYRHFKSKRDVLVAAIRANTQYIVAECAKIVDGPGSAVKRLANVGVRVTEILFERKDFLVAIFDFVFSMVRKGENMGNRIVNFTSVTRGTFRRLLKEGKKEGVFDRNIDIQSVMDALFSQFESSAMRIALGLETRPGAAKKRFMSTVAAIARGGGENF